MKNYEPTSADELPVLEPLPSRPPTKEELRAKYIKPGFGFWMTGVWCVLYLLVTQILVGVGVSVVGLAYLSLRDTDAGATPDAGAIMKDPAMITVMLAAIICAHAAGILFSMGMLRLLVGKSWVRRIALTRLPSLSQIVILVLAFPALLTLIGLIQEPVMKYVPSVKDIAGMEGLDDFMKTLPTWPLSGAIIAIAVLPGIGEELWCRGFLGQGTAARHGVMWSILITSFYFGLIHLEPPQALLAMIIGLAIHCVYFCTRSLPACIAMHFANNALVVLHEGHWARVLTPIEEVTARSPVLLGLSAAFLVAAAGYALVQTRARLESIEPEMPVWEPKGVASVEVPPRHTGTVVRHGSLSPLAVGLIFAAALAYSLVLALA